MSAKQGRPGPSSHRAWTALISIAVLLGLAVGGVDPVQAASVSSKRQEALRLQAQIDRLNDRLSALDEDSNQAKVRLAQSQQSLRAAERSATAARTQLDRRKAALQQRVLLAYAQAGGAVGAVDLGQSLDDNVRRQAYLDTARGRDLDAIDALAAAREDFDRTQAQARAARAAAKIETQAIATATRRGEQLLVEQERLLARTKGELGRLIAAEQARLAREEEAKAKRELQRRLAAARTELQRRRAEAELLRIRGRRPGLATTRSATNGRGASNRNLAVDAGLDSGLPPAPGGASAIAAAKAQLGKPYLWGAGGTAAFDCSGLTSYAWRAAGKSLPHSSRAQYGSTVRVSMDQLRPGDLLFYGSPIHHVGLYIGNGMMVEAPHRGALVRTRSIYRRDLVGAGRVS